MVALKVGSGGQAGQSDFELNSYIIRNKQINLQSYILD